VRGMDLDKASSAASERLSLGHHHPDDLPHVLELTCSELCVRGIGEIDKSIFVDKKILGDV